MTVRAFQSSVLSAVNRNEAGSGNPVVIEFFLAFWAR